MTPQLRLEKIEYMHPHFSYEDHEWLIARVKQLEKALKFYAEVFPMPVEVVAHNEKDKKFEEISTALLNTFHTTARKALNTNPDGQ